MNRFALLMSVALATGCSEAVPVDERSEESVREAIFAVHDAQVAAMVDGRSTADYLTSNWRGVNLNGTPMSAEGFEGEDRAMLYDSIQVLDREVRSYGQTAALRWHANFYVKVNGQPSFAEMRILDVYLLEDGRWVNDLTQVTPVYGTVGNPPQ